MREALSMNGFAFTARRGAVWFRPRDTSGYTNPGRTVFTHGLHCACWYSRSTGMLRCLV